MASASIGAAPWQSTSAGLSRCQALAAGGPVDGVGITAQRASAIAWDGRTGTPVGPGLGWQDLRTAGTCLELQADGVRYAPSESATKFAWLLEQAEPDQREHIKL